MRLQGFTTENDSKDSNFPQSIKPSPPILTSPKKWYQKWGCLITIAVVLGAIVITLMVSLDDSFIFGIDVQNESHDMFVETTLSTADSNSPKYVDLGLPSGIKWAICNIGASTSEEFGNYYSWGEIRVKAAYHEENSITYGTETDSYGGDPKYDVASYLLGEGWRTPTRYEFEELFRICKMLLSKQNGTTGIKLVAPNGNSVFFPLGGQIYEGEFEYSGEYGYYWSSTKYERNFLGEMITDMPTV